MSTANLPAFDTLETYTERFSEFRLGHSELLPDLRHYCRWICGHPSRLPLTVFNFNRFSESSVNTSISILLSIAPLVLKAPLIRQRSSLSSMLSNKPTIDTTYTARQSNQSRWSLRFVHWWSKYDEILSWFLNGSLIELAEEQWDHRRSLDSASTSSIDVGMESISHSAFKRPRSSKVSHNKQNWRSEISPVNSNRLIVDAGTVLRSANASRDSFCDRRNDRRCRAKSDWISGLIKKFTTSPWIIWCPKELLLNHFGYDNVSI